MAFFSETYLESLPENPILAAHEMATKIVVADAAPTGRNSTNRAEIFEAHTLLFEFCKQTFPKHLICPSPGDPEDLRGFLRSLIPEVNSVKARMAKEKNEPQLQVLLSRVKGIQSPTYSFNTDDFGHIQQHINSLRQAVQESQSLSDDHSFRLLKRIEKVQNELHQKMKTVDHICMMVFDGMIAVTKLSKAGTEAAKEAAKLAFWLNAIQKILSHTVVEAEGLDGFSLMGGSDLAELAEKAEK